jgi:hypothetical protein
VIESVGFIFLQFSSLLFVVFSPSVATVLAMGAAGVLIALSLFTVGYAAVVGYKKGSMTNLNITSTTTDRVKYQERLQDIEDMIFGRIVVAFAVALLITVCAVARHQVLLMKRMW